VPLLLEILRSWQEHSRRDIRTIAEQVCHTRVVCIHDHAAEIPSLAATGPIRGSPFGAPDQLPRVLALAVGFTGWDANPTLTAMVILLLAPVVVALLVLKQRLALASRFDLV